MNKTILTTVLALCFSAAAGGVGYAVTNNYNQAKIKDLNTQVEQKETANVDQRQEISGLNKSINSLTVEKDNLIAENNNKSESIKNLQSDIENKQTQIENLNSQISSNNTQISNLQADIDEKKAEIARLEAEIATNNTTINDLNTQLTQKQSELAALQLIIAEKDNTISNLSKLKSKVLDISLNSDLISLFSDQSFDYSCLFSDGSSVFYSNYNNKKFVRIDKNFNVENVNYTINGSSDTIGFFGSSFWSRNNVMYYGLKYIFNTENYDFTSVNWTVTDGSKLSENAKLWTDGIDYYYSDMGYGTYIANFDNHTLTKVDYYNEISSFNGFVYKFDDNHYYAWNGSFWALDTSTHTASIIDLNIKDNNICGLGNDGFHSYLFDLTFKYFDNESQKFIDLDIHDLSVSSFLSKDDKSKYSIFNLYDNLILIYRDSSSNISCAVLV